MSGPLQYRLTDTIMAFGGPADQETAMRSELEAILRNYLTDAGPYNRFHATLIENAARAFAGKIRYRVNRRKVLRIDRITVQYRNPNINRWKRWIHVVNGMSQQVLGEYV